MKQLKKIILLLILPLTALMATTQCDKPIGENTVFKVSDTPLAVGERIPTRIMMFILRGNEDKAKMRTLIDDCAKYHFTHVFFEARAAGVKYDILVEDGRFKFLPNAWSKAEFQDLINYCVSRGLKVIPQIKLLTHQYPQGFAYSFDKTHPFMMNKNTYNPNNPELMSIVYGMIDELIDMFTVNGEKPDLIGIGHDEVTGIWPFNNNKWLDYDVSGSYNSDGICNDRILSAAEFKNHILNLYNKITIQKGIRIAMYADVLIQRKEIPTDRFLYGHAGRIEGEANEWVQVRHELPRDIIMIDWRYGIPDKCDGTCDGTKFPSYDIMQNDERYDTHGMTWATSEGNETRMNNFIDHMLATGNSNCAVYAAQFYLSTNAQYFDMTRSIIQKTGTYAYNTLKK